MQQKRSAKLVRVISIWKKFTQDVQSSSVYGADNWWAYERMLGKTKKKEGRAGRFANLNLVFITAP
jgi:hypothetical protein